jgi:hypothetical protein
VRTGRNNGVRVCFTRGCDWYAPPLDCTGRDLAQRRLAGDAEIVPQTQAFGVHEWSARITGEDPKEPCTGDPSPAASAPARLNAIYTSPENPTRLAIFRQVYGLEYPEEVAPRSFITMPLLRRMAQGLAVGPEATIIDLGCGRAGPVSGSRETGASLVGVDLASAGTAQASRRAQELGLADQA